MSQTPQTSPPPADEATSGTPKIDGSIVRLTAATRRFLALWFEWWDLLQKHKLVVGGSTIITFYFAYLGTVILFGKCFGLSSWFEKNWHWFFIKHKQWYQFYKDAREAHDIALGIGGVLIGFFIALMIERSNREKSKILEGETKKISDATEKIKQLTTGVAEDIRRAAFEAKKLEVITDYSKLLEKIHSVMEHAKQSDAPLLIMNLTASFGYFMTFDSDRILGTDHLPLDEAASERKTKLDAKTQLDYHRNWTRTRNKQRENFAVLCQCAVGDVEGRPKKLVRYATLRATPKPGEKLEDLPFEMNYLHSSLEGAQVETYLSESTGKFSITHDDDKKLYLIPDKEILTTTPDKLNAFKELLVKDQADKIKKLKDAHVEVLELEETPFQLFLSLSGKEHDPGICLFMFVNQHTLSRTNRLAAFVTSDREILAAFRAIFESVTKTTTPKVGQTTTPAPVAASAKPGVDV